MADLSIQISSLVFKHWRFINDKPFQDLVLDLFDELYHMIQEKKWEKRDAFNLARSFVEDRLESNIGRLYRMNYKEKELETDQKTCEVKTNKCNLCAYNQKHTNGDQQFCQSVPSLCAKQYKEICCEEMAQLIQGNKYLDEIMEKNFLIMGYLDENAEYGSFSIRFNYCPNCGKKQQKEHRAPGDKKQ